MDSLEVPVMRKVGPGGTEAGGKWVEVGVWSDTCEAVDQGKIVADWLSAFLEMVRFSRFSRVSYINPDESYGYNTLV